MMADTPRRDPPRRLDLLQPLAARLPGVSTAVDPRSTVERLDRLVADGTHVAAATAEALWFRPDGSCSLRYQVTTAPDGGPGRRHLVLARVCPSAAAARRYLDEVAALATGSRPPAPWRSWTAKFDDAPVAVHLFPVDPAVPTLAAVTDLEDLRPEGWTTRDSAGASREVVRHPREGGVVLRYRTSSGAARGSGVAEFYAKVYPDATGAVVHHFLSSLERGTASSTTSRPVRLPRSLGYRADLRVLLTEALPGQPVLPALVRGLIAPARGSFAGPQATSLRAAVGEAGRALAALHGLTQAVAPAQEPGQVWHRLDRELEVVAEVWPETAAAVRRAMGEALQPTAECSERVLCHGDYTPSQILFRHGRASGLVDLDTVCWGDPAMDLGRFLAHLDMSLARAGGPGPPPLGRELRSDFLAAYERWADRPADEGFLARVDVFRKVALAISALHACRQLKERRLELALSLLEHDPDPTGDPTRRNA